MEPLRLTSSELATEAQRGCGDPPGRLSIPTLLCNCLVVPRADPSWIRGRKDFFLGSLVFKTLGRGGYCTPLFPSWGTLHLGESFAVRWPHDVLGPLPLRPRWACEGLIPTASDKGNSCKMLICCLQTRLWGMLENLKVNVSLASGIK